MLAATEHLHKRIANLTGRIHQLESALATLQSEQSSEPHPLLHDDLVAVHDDAMGLSDDPAAGPPHPTDAVIDAFGTLSISEHGVSRFFGPTGGSEVRPSA